MWFIHFKTDSKRGIYRVVDYKPPETLPEQYLKLWECLVGIHKTNDIVLKSV